MRNIDKYTQDYKEAPFEDTRVRIRRDFVLEQIRKYPHESILEIGCGTEPLFMHMSDYKQMTIVEPSAVFFANAEKLSAEKSNVFCIKGFFEQSLNALSQRSYDIIIISSLLHEVEDPVSFLSIVKQICKPETVVHINVPNANSFHKLLGFETGLIRSVVEVTDSNRILQQNIVYDIDTLGDLLKSNGFNIIESCTGFVKPFSHAQMQKMLDCGIIDDATLSGLSHMSKYLPDFGSEIYINCRIKEEN